jgi:hypothetical protein
VDKHRHHSAIVRRVAVQGEGLKVRILLIVSNIVLGVIQSQLLMFPGAGFSRKLVERRFKPL